MKSTFATLALVGAAAAAPHAGHAAFHAKKDLGDLFSGLTNDLASFVKVGQSAWSSIKALDGESVLPAHNSQTATSTSWIGEASEGNAVVNTIINKSEKDATWVCWAKSSWVTKDAPALAVAVPAGKSVNVSHAISQDEANGNSGGCAPMFEGDGLNHAGQPNQAWMEFTFVTGQWVSSTYDLSMEVNSNGHNMTIAGPECESSLTACSFHCNDASATYCGESGTYHLLNCAEGSQKGATAGLWGNDAAGGCQGISNTGITNLITTLH